MSSDSRRLQVSSWGTAVARTVESRSRCEAGMVNEGVRKFLSATTMKRWGISISATLGAYGQTSVGLTLHRPVLMKILRRLPRSNHDEEIYTIV